MTDGCTIDRTMRAALLAAAAAESASVHRDLMVVLARGPRPDVAAILKRYGPELPAATAKIGPLVDRLEVALPGPVGFIRWCKVTGFGDDPLMFEVFLKWADVMVRDRRLSPAIDRDLARRVLQ